VTSGSRDLLATGGVPRARLRAPLWQQVRSLALSDRWTSRLRCRKIYEAQAASGLDADDAADMGAAPGVSSRLESPRLRSVSPGKN